MKIHTNALIITFITLVVSVIGLYFLVSRPCACAEKLDDFVMPAEENLIKN